MTTLSLASTDWIARSACRAEPDLWFSDAPAARRLAIHICRTHCPVRDRCAADAARMPCSYGVQAGVAYNQHGVPLDPQPRPSNRACPTCAAVRPADTRRPPTRWDDCGTSAAYRRHCRRDERACDPCAEANRQRERDRKARQSAQREAA